MINSGLMSWQSWAFLSAVFAALTAIFAKIGVSEINSDMATLIRTAIILAVLTLIVLATGQWQALSGITSRTWLFLTLSALATGASWVCYFRALKIGDAARVATDDKRSSVLVAVFGVLILGERLSGINWLGVGLCTAGIILVAMR